MRLVILIFLLSGCTVVLWSDDVYVHQDTGVGDDTNLPKRLKHDNTK